MEHKKTSPKDFFLWLGAIIALYFSVGSFVTLLFALINDLFSGVVGYTASFSGSMTFALANLIIIFPLYLALTRMLNQHIRKSPELKELWVRRWAVFLTVFLAGLGIMIDLIVLVYTFLSGEELTAAFLLKVLAILAVFGMVFFYYLRDIKGYWEKHEKSAKRFGGVVAVVILASIIAGFFVIGTPATQRKYRDDHTRISDLQQIQYAIGDYYNSKEALPESLSDLNDAFYGSYVESDPKTGVSYEYTVLGGTQFEICATFELASPVVDETKADLSDYQVRNLIQENEEWGHGAEYTCFTREVDEDFYGVKPVRLVD